MEFSENFLDRIEDLLIKEEWKKIIIDGDITHYSVSSLGRVKNDNSELILKNRYRGSGINKYCSVCLWHNNKGKNMSVHRLVAQAFIPNPYNKPQVNHKDGNKQNNHMNNLEWVTNQENIKHAIAHGLIQYKNGKNCPSHKYSEQDVHNVCRLLEKGYSRKDICKKLNVSFNLVDGIKYHKHWSDISSKYKIPSSNPYYKHDADQIMMIDEYIRNGEHNRRKLIAMMNLPYNKTNISYIKYRIKINKNAVRSSTTIPEGSTP